MADTGHLTSLCLKEILVRIATSQLSQYLSYTAKNPAYPTPAFVSHTSMYVHLSKISTAVAVNDSRECN